MGQSAITGTGTSLPLRRTFDVLKNYSNNVMGERFTLNKLKGH
jgi:hypothetical protein